MRLPATTSEGSAGSQLGHRFPDHAALGGTRTDCQLEFTRRAVRGQNSLRPAAGFRHLSLDTIRIGG
jgi:hypothetical protein